MKIHHLFGVVTLLAAIFAINGVDGQSNANPKIPPHLLPCYRNPDYYPRENRYPNIFRVFIDLIREIEKSPGGQQKSAKELATALLYHLRLDGIQQTPTVQQTQDITPFAPGGTNYYKHRLTLVGLLPKSSRPTNYDFFNDSLTQNELCDLHFMLSYSIDPYKRENEDCSIIKYEDGNRAGYDTPYYGYTYDTYRRNPPRRFRRAMRNVESRIRILRRSLENLRRRRQVLRESRRRKRSSGKEENPDVEVIPQNVLASMSKSEAKKGDFTLGYHDYLGPGEDHVMRGGYGRYPVMSGEVGRRTATYSGEPTSAFIPGQPLSECPIENGVIRTKYGSLTIGTVIAGIAAGFNHQKLLLSEFNTYLRGPLASERIDNIWATTLAGNAADLILSYGFINNLREAVGLRGGWDSLTKPTTYMLQMGKPNYLTDVELRGALDGLWLGLTVEKYKKLLGNVPLSSILEMYYSEDGFFLDPKVRASDRGEQAINYAPTEEFKKQAHVFAAVMENQRINKVTFSDFTNAVGETVAAINSYIPLLSSGKRERSSRSSLVNLDPQTNFAIAFDPNWDFDDLEFQIFSFIESDIAASPGQSNLTIICGTDGSVYPIPDSKAYMKNFKNIYNDCKRRVQSINYQSIYGLFEDIYNQVLREENTIRRVIPQSHVALFMISERQTTPDPEYINDYKENLRDKVPDIHIFAATNGPKDRFGSLVFDPDRDIFSVRKGEESTELIQRIEKVPRRIGNPSYGNGDSNLTSFEGDSITEDYVRIGRNAIYAIHPFYFYNSKEVRLSLRTRGQEVTVCHARQQMLLPPHMQRTGNDNPYPDVPPQPNFPDEDSGNENKCKKGSSVSFTFEDLCEDASDYRDCIPLFISVEAPYQDKFDVQCVNCRYPFSVQYTIQVSGLTSSATVIFSSFVLLVACIATSLISN